MFRPVRICRLRCAAFRPQSLRAFSTEAASHPANKIQVYRCTSSDPFVNLSIEHHLLQKTDPESNVLLFYTNSPSVVIGRNQNPWLEVNLPRLALIRDEPGQLGWTDAPINLVRRRSGGGTVFHDGGNVNFSVICPPTQFNRDKYAEMVVQALKRLGRPNTRVNERHDIVMDVAPENDIHTFKISGSAYKLTRQRSLHHGTCLLRSPNLANISGLLRSPAEGFIKARGVDSVRSPVRNVDVDNSMFEEAAMAEFRNMHGNFDVHEEVGEEALEIDSIRSGCEELRSREWIYGQTPRFTVSTSPTEEDPRARPLLPFNKFQLKMEARHGVLEHFGIDTTGTGEAANVSDPSSYFLQRKMVDIEDWNLEIGQAGFGAQAADSVGAWLNQVLGTAFTRKRRQS